MEINDSGELGHLNEVKKVYFFSLKLKLIFLPIMVRYQCNSAISAWSNSYISDVGY